MEDGFGHDDEEEILEIQDDFGLFSSDVDAHIEKIIEVGIVILGLAFVSQHSCVNPRIASHSSNQYELWQKSYGKEAALSK